jgi:lipoprotein-anchoring transpeptidase ErfK/SrfK
VISGGTTVESGVDREDFERPKKGPPPVVKAKGAKVPGTRAIQTRLAQLRYLPKNAVDGRYGYRTQQAVIAFQSWERLDRDGIVGPITAQALETAHRPRPRKGGPKKRIEVRRERGVALLVKGGKTKRAVHVSTGAPGTETPAGRYRVFRKELQSWSVPFSTWLPYASYFNRGIAFHEYPDVPTYPASHGCVRVPAPEAKFVYEFAAIDRVVVVY